MTQNKQLRVCVAGSFGPSGVSASGARVASLAEGLVAHGFKVSTVGLTSAAISSEDFLLGSRMGIRTELTIENGVNAVLVRRRRLGENWGGPISSLIQQALAASAFAANVRAWSRTNGGGTLVLYGHRGELLLLAAGLARISHCHLVVDVTEWLDWRSCRSFGSWLSAQIAQRVVPRLVGYATVISDLTAIRLPQSLMMIHLPAMAPDDVAQRAEVQSSRQKPGADPSEFRCVFTGSEGGGLASLIKLLGGLAERHPKTRFVLRTTGPLHSLSARGIAERVSIQQMGYLPKRAYLDLLEDADCLVIPGRESTNKDFAFPNRLPEYLLSGTPTVISGYPAAARLIQDGEHALVLRTDDEAELSRAIETVLLNPIEMDQMAQKGRLHALETFRAVDVVRPLADAIRRMHAPL